MSVKTLAVKYRPKGWGEVVEQEETKLILQQQLKTGTIKNAYLFVGPAGCGKTTCARIFANEINEGKGNPIEMDAASNSGVDDVREIIQQAKTKSLDSEYKVFIIDECVTGDVEILTTSGFKRFDECDGTEFVAQYDDGKIEFVKPEEWIKNNYCGDLIKWSPRNWCSIRMTPNHVQPLFYEKSQIVKEKYIKDIKFNQSNDLIVSGHGVGKKTHLTALDKLAIVCQADATVQSVNKDYTHWSISLVKSRKIDRLLQIFKDGDIEYSEIKTSSGKRRFTFNTTSNITKYFCTYFDLDFDYYGAREFINEVVLWDGYKTDKYVEYMSTEKINSDFVSAIASLGGYSARQRIQKDDRQVHYKDVYKVFLYDREFSNCQYIKKTVEREFYNGYVYCVKVPSHQIVIRSQGFVFITGNCHSISNTGWQAFLKLIEEPPAKSIFIFCTTNPEKIPKTILSRVQRYQFKKISEKGITERLESIIVIEGKKSDIKYTMDALEYLSKVSEGGMRDAISSMDKCLSYSLDLTVDNVVKALGTTNYTDMMKLSGCIVNHHTKQVIEIIESLHSEGKDLKQFVKNYQYFLLDVQKYALGCDFNLLQIPKTTEMEKWLSNRTDDDFDYLLSVLDVVVKLSTQIKYSNYPKADIEAELLLFMQEERL